MQFAGLVNFKQTSSHQATLQWRTEISRYRNALANLAVQIEHAFT